MALPWLAGSRRENQSNEPCGFHFLLAETAIPV